MEPGRPRPGQEERNGLRAGRLQFWQMSIFD